MKLPNTHKGSTNQEYQIIEQLFEQDKGLLFQNMKVQLINALADTINIMHAANQSEKAFPEYGLRVYNNLMGEGLYVTDDYLSCALNGTYEPIDQVRVDQFTYFPEMPVREDFGRDLQVFLSEHTLNTAVRSLIQNKWGDYETYMTGLEVSMIIEDFEEIFDHHDYLKVVLKATPIETLSAYSLPKIDLKKDVSQFDFYGDVQIMNPFDESVPTLTLECHFTAYLNFRISEDLKLFIEAD